VVLRRQKGAVCGRELKGNENPSPSEIFKSERRIINRCGMQGSQKKRQGKVVMNLHSVQNGRKAIDLSLITYTG